ncbi:hypothetical protein IFM47457_07450 [Aspergillus lentulus]|nr:hypothetical protein IFM47457_07450 [Aspergillus lentulus]
MFGTGGGTKKEDRTSSSSHVQSVILTLRFALARIVAEKRKNMGFGIDLFLFRESFADNPTIIVRYHLED